MTVPARFEARDGLWGTAQQARLDALLLQAGAVLIHGLDVVQPGPLEDLARASGSPLVGSYPELPALPGRVSYSVTPYPTQRWIEFHNEAAHRARWPLRLVFCCAIPAAQGGGTPVVDMRRLRERLPTSFKARVERQGLLYRRRFLPGLDQPWQQVFGSDDPQVVAALCRQRGEDCCFEGPGVRVQRRAQPLRVHPETGEEVFFSQLLLHHPRLLPPEVREAAVLLFGPEALPRDLRYGDGSPLCDDLVDEIAGLHHELALRFDWQAGDVLVIDNLLASHAREPYQGARQHFVALVGEDGP